MKTDKAKQIAERNNLDLWWNIHQKEWTLHNKAENQENYESKTFKSYEIQEFSESQFEYICINIRNVGENEQ